MCKKQQDTKDAARPRPNAVQHLQVYKRSLLKKKRCTPRSYRCLCCCYYTLFSTLLCIRFTVHILFNCSGESSIPSYCPSSCPVEELMKNECCARREMMMLDDDGGEKTHATRRRALFATKSSNC